MTAGLRVFALATLCTLGLTLASAPAARADATFTCLRGTYPVTSTTTISVDSSSGDCNMSGSIPSGATVTLRGQRVTVTSSNSSNAGTVQFASGNTWFGTAPGDTFSNTGTVVDNATGSRQTMYAGRLMNTGTISCAGAGGNLTFDGGSSNLGVLENADGGSLRSTAAANFEVDGPMSLQLDPSSATTISSGGTLAVKNSTLTVAGGAVSGVLTGFQDGIVFNSSATSSTGTINHTSDGSLTGTIPAGWTVRETGGGIGAAAGAGNSGIFVLGGANPSLTAAATFTNAGTIVDAFSGGVAALTAPDLISAGTIAVPAGSSLAVNGDLSLSPSSVLTIGVAGTGGGSFGTLRVTGSAALGGTIDARLASGYAPASGDRQEILSAGSLSGTFARSLGTNALGFYTVRYSPTTVTLVTTLPSVAPQPPALSGLRMAPSAFHPVSTRTVRHHKNTTGGATITYRDSRAALTKFRVLRQLPGRKSGRSCVAPSKRNRRGRPCTRLVAVGGFSHQDRAGSVTLRFSGKLSRRALSRGSYVLSAVAKLQGWTSATVQLTFRIV